MNTTRIILLCLSLAASGFGWCPIYDRNAAPKPSRAHEGSLSTAQSEATGVLKTPERKQVEEIKPGIAYETGQSGASVVAGSADRTGRSIVAAAASNTQTKQANPGLLVFLGASFLTIGLGIAFGLKSYANKIVPEAKLKNTKNAGPKPGFK